MSYIPKRKAWCFTLNNYTEEEYVSIIKALESCSVYFVVGKEIGEKGTPHLQGYTLFRESHTLSSVKDRLSQRCHLEAARGSSHDNRTYCTKGGDSIQFGKCPGKPDKKDRDTLAREWRSKLGEGRSGISEFADENPGVFAWSGHTLLRNSLGIAGAVPRPNISVRWIYGAPGVGKSRFAHEQLPNAYIKEPRTKWWNGYLLEKEVIIDDFGPCGIDINHLLRWFDRYKCYVEVKGDMCPLCAEVFIVTSNFHPDEIFSFGGEKNKQLPALLRRIELIEM